MRPLTKHERTLLTLAKQDFTYNVIASKLGVAHQTVKHQLVTIHMKLGADNNCQTLAKLTAEDLQAILDSNDSDQNKLNQVAKLMEELRK